MRFTTAALCLVLAAPAAAEVFKWIGDDGAVHYGDRAPPAGARTVELPPASIYTPRQLPAVDTGAAEGDAEPVEDVVKYSTVAILSPTEDETVRDNTGAVPLVVELEPALQEGHRMAVLLDDRTIFDQLTTREVVISNVDRGTHSLMVRVLNASGAQQAESAPVTFHLHRATVLRPTPRN